MHRHCSTRLIGTLAALALILHPSSFTLAQTPGFKASGGATYPFTTTANSNQTFILDRGGGSSPANIRAGQFGDAVGLVKSTNFSFSLSTETRDWRKGLRLLDGTNDVAAFGAFGMTGGHDEGPNHLNLDRLYKFRWTMLYSNRPFHIVTLTDELAFPGRDNMVANLRGLLGKEGGKIQAGGAEGDLLITPVQAPRDAGPYGHTSGTPSAFETNTFVQSFGYHTLSNGASSSLTWSRIGSGLAGTNVYSDKAHVMFLAGPGQGTFLIQTNIAGSGWGTWTTVAAAQATAELVVTHLTMPLTDHQLRVVGVSGTNRIAGAGLWRSNAKTLHYSYLQCNSGPHLGHVLNNTNVFKPFWSALKPDLILILDRGYTNNVGYYYTFKAYFDEVCPDADVVIFDNYWMRHPISDTGSTDNGSNVDTLALNAGTRMAAKQLDWGFFDHFYYWPHRWRDDQIERGVKLADGHHLSQEGSWFANEHHLFKELFPVAGWASPWYVNKTFFPNAQWSATVGGDVVAAGQNNFSGSNNFTGVTRFAHDVLTEDLLVGMNGALTTTGSQSGFNFQDRSIPSNYGRHLVDLNAIHLRTSASVEKSHLIASNGSGALTIFSDVIYQSGNELPRMGHPDGAGYTYHGYGHHLKRVHGPANWFVPHRDWVPADAQVVPAIISVASPSPVSAFDYLRFQDAGSHAIARRSVPHGYGHQTVTLTLWIQATNISPVFYPFYTEAIHYTTAGRTITTSARQEIQLTNGVNVITLAAETFPDDTNPRNLSLIFADNTNSAFLWLLACREVWSP